MTSLLRASTAVSSLAIAGLIAGCAGPLGRGSERQGLAAGARGATVGAATRAHVALASGDYGSAVTWAEQAVGNNPKDATLRGLLGNAYLGAGRFASAAATYQDALTLAPGQSAVALKLVLAEIAQGKDGSAIQLLDQLRGAVDPADVGLALALAGQPGNAVALLDEAARQPGADGRTRQNLALAHALAGDWEMARAVAGQDLPADQIDARLQGWMALAKPQSPAVQVASLLGVTPAATDPGQPVRLALAETQVRLASVAPVPSAPVPPIELPAEQPALAATETTVMNDPGFAAAPVPVEPVAVAAASVTIPLPAPVPAPAPAEAPMQLANVGGELDSIRREPVRPSGALPKVAQLRRSAAARFARSGVVVQLGAYGSRGRVQAAWSMVVRRHGSLSRYTPASARFQSAGGTVYRLSLKGFASDGEARSLCQQLKRSGSACFVRNVAGDTPVRFAAR
uniref:SPOR domain-containing protein n=1 Tax=uncultured Sphingomonas sp. TaxID=158754 RepID=UPI0026000749|nr:SPOR domain-containing protein [uncultured Sphingomonas sp.]